MSTLFRIDSTVGNEKELENKVMAQIVERNIPITQDKFVKDEETSLNVNYQMIDECLREITEGINQMNDTRFINDFVITSHRPVIGKVIIMIKRVIRKSTYWLIRPYYNQQQNFNASTVRTVEQMNRLQKQIINAIKIFDEDK